MPLYSDSSTTVFSANSQMVHPGSRWNSIRIHWLQQQVLDQLIQVCWCAGENMKADVLTKFIVEISKFMEVRDDLMNQAYRFTEFYGLYLRKFR